MNFFEEINTLANTSLDCRIAEAITFGEKERRLLQEGNISALFVGKKICVADNLFGSYCFVVADEREIDGCESLASEWYTLGFPLVPQEPFLLKCDATQDAWACFCFNVMQECLGYNGSFSTVLRSNTETLAELKKSLKEMSEEEFLVAYKDPKPGIEDAPLAELRRTTEYNRQHIDEWAEYVAVVFSEPDSVWDMNEAEYTKHMTLMGRAFGEVCAKDLDLFTTLVTSYGKMSLEQFKEEFVANAKLAKVNIKFASNNEARRFHDYIRCAYCVVDTRVKEIYLAESLTEIHKHTFPPNIFAKPLPFKVFLPLYWYVSRFIFLTNGPSSSEL